MRKILVSLTLVFFSMALSACSEMIGSDWGNGSTIKQVIEETSKGLTLVFSKGDAIAISNFYAEDGKVLPSNSEVVIGRDAIQKFFQGFFDATISRELILQPIEIDFRDGLAYEAGIYSEKYRPKSENQAQAIVINVIETGKYTTVWKHQMDGSWQIAVDIWNADTPTQ